MSCTEAQLKMKQAGCSNQCLKVLLWGVLQGLLMTRLTADGSVVEQTVVRVDLEQVCSVLFYMI